MQEIFKDIPNYEGIYQVSNLGNVKSLKFKKEKLLKLRANRYGYLYVILYNKPKKIKNIQVHKLVAITFLNHVPKGHTIVVDHINNIKTDNRLENLQIITQRENSSKDKKGTSKYTGVHWDKKSKKWRASININQKNIRLGFFDNEYNAHLAYQNKLKEL